MKGGARAPRPSRLEGAAQAEDEGLLGGEDRCGEEAGADLYEGQRGERAPAEADDGNQGGACGGPEAEHAGERVFGEQADEAGDKVADGKKEMF